MPEQEPSVSEIDRLHREVNAAWAILFDGRADRREAAGHLGRGWLALARALAAAVIDPAPSSGNAAAYLGRRLADEPAFGWTPDLEREIATLLTAGDAWRDGAAEPESEQDAFTHEQLHRHGRLLDGALETTGLPPHPSWARVRRGRAIALVTIGVAALVILTLAIVTPPPSEERQVKRQTLTEDLVIDFGTEAARVNLGAGWSNDEKVDERTAVWSAASSSEIALPLAPASAYRLAMKVRPFAEIVPFTVTLTLNDRVVGELPIATDDWQTLRVSLPEAAVATGIDRLRLTYSRTGRPSDYGAKDGRSLALLLDSLQVRAE